MSESKYQISVILRKEQEGGFSVQCVELPGIISEGETKKEALDNIREATIGYLEANNILKISNIISLN